MNGNAGVSFRDALHSYQGSMGGYGDRHPRRNLPDISTGKITQNDSLGMQTPGTAFEMNFTPLLPSQLLLGSPFQPGSPSFGSGQFQSLSSISHQNAAAQLQNQQNHHNGNGQAQATTISPQQLNGMMSPSAIGAPQMFPGPQSPTAMFNPMVNQAISAYGGPPALTAGMMTNTSRTVYLGNIPPQTSAEDILSHIRSGQIESVRLLPDKSCAFISFLDSSSATHFHSDAILKKLSIKGNDIKIGWGKPTQVPTSVAFAVQQSGASRNIYLGNLPEDITEEEIREDLGKFGPIDIVKIVREKAIAFVHFLSISNAIKAVSQLPQDPKWQSPRRVYYGKDRCAYVSKTQQQNAAQYLGIAPGYAHVLNGADRDLISNALAQQSVAAAAVATSAGGASNLGNRTVYLGNIHPETTVEEICNVVRGGLLHHIRYIPDKHICFVTFIDPTSAASFYALSNLQGLMIHNRRLKIGWGKHSGALPPAIALAVSGGASRNVYIGNLDESWTEERLRQDFAEYGEIELVNALRVKSCAFVNFTNIANAIKAIEAVRGKDDYKRYKINFGKDRCGNPPRQTNAHHNNNMSQSQGGGGQDASGSPAFTNGHNMDRYHNGTGNEPSDSSLPSMNSAQNDYQFHADSNAAFNAGNGNPLMTYLQQQSNEGSVAGLYKEEQDQMNHPTRSQHQHQHHRSQKSQSTVQADVPSLQSMYYDGDSPFQGAKPSNAHHQHNHSHHHHPIGHNPSHSFNLSNGFSSSSLLSSSSSGTGAGAGSGAGAPTVGGFLAPSNLNSRGGGQHLRTISLPVFSQGPGSNDTTKTSGAGAQGFSGRGADQELGGNLSGLGSGLGGFGSSGNGFGLLGK